MKKIIPYKIYKKSNYFRQQREENRICSVKMFKRSVGMTTIPTRIQGNILEKFFMELIGSFLDTFFKIDGYSYIDHIHTNTLPTILVQFYFITIALLFRMDI